MGIKDSSETGVLAACLDFLALAGVFCWRENNVAVYDPAKRCYRRFRGKKGVSDILGVLPPGGRLIAVEVKKPGGRVREEQHQFLDAVFAAGGLALVVSDVRQLQAALRAEKIIG